MLIHNVLNSLANVIKEPLLRLSTGTSSLEDNVSSTVEIKDSLHWEFRNNVEWSVNVETEFLVKSFSWCFLFSIAIDNAPSLIWSIVSLPNLNVITFRVSVSSNIKYFTALDILENITLINEDLPPARISAPHLDVARSTSISDV